MGARRRAGYDTISPIDTFRAIFGKRFSAR